MSNTLSTKSLNLSTELFNADDSLMSAARAYSAVSATDDYDIEVADLRNAARRFVAAELAAIKER